MDHDEQAGTECNDCGHVHHTNNNPRICGVVTDRAPNGEASAICVCSTDEQEINRLNALLAAERKRSEEREAAKDAEIDKHSFEAASLASRVRTLTARCAIYEERLLEAYEKIAAKEEEVRVLNQECEWAANDRTRLMGEIAAQAERIGELTRERDGLHEIWKQAHEELAIAQPLAEIGRLAVEARRVFYDASAELRVTDAADAYRAAEDGEKGEPR